MTDDERLERIQKLQAKRASARRPRRHVAVLGRVTAAGFSFAATLGLVGGMALADRWKTTKLNYSKDGAETSTLEGGLVGNDVVPSQPVVAPPPPEEIIRVVRRKIYVEVPADAGVGQAGELVPQQRAPSRAAQPPANLTPAPTQAAPASPHPAPSRPAPATKSRAS